MAQTNRAKSIAGSGNGPTTYIVAFANGQITNDADLTAVVEEYGMVHTIAGIEGTVGGAMAMMLQGGESPATSVASKTASVSATFVSP